MHTRVLSLQRCVAVDGVPPNTQFRCIVGWKLAPSTVTSIPPNVGPEDGMSRWMRGGGKLIEGGGSCLKSINGIAIGGGAGTGTARFMGSGIVCGTG